MSIHRFAIWLAVAFFLVAPFARAEEHMAGEGATADAATAPTTVPWDAKRVAELAATVSESAGKMRRTIAQQPDALPGSGQQKFQYRLKDELRLIRTEANQLAKQVSKGGTRAETQPIYDRLRQLVLNARQDAVKLRLDEATLAHVATARKALTELAPLYGEEPLPPVPALRSGEGS